jgi:hypothetical protein
MSRGATAESIMFAPRVRSLSRQSASTTYIKTRRKSRAKDGKGIAQLIRTASWFASPLAGLRPPSHEPRPV